MSLVVREAGPADLPAVFALRHHVFVVGQGVPADMELDEHDERCDHAVATLDGRVVGTGRLLPPTPAGVATIGRMAVADGHRGSGIGAALLAALERRAGQRGYAEVELHAQVHARPFYDKAGYEPVGGTYLEAGIEHVTMRKRLSGRGRPSTTW